jgi:hypothetical protein
MSGALAHEMRRSSAPTDAFKLMATSIASTVKHERILVDYSNVLYKSWPDLLAMKCSSLACT